jgi:uncharacterized protein GlcG (DUF336 family)
MNKAIHLTQELSYESALEMCRVAISHACSLSVDIAVEVLTPAGLTLTAVRMNHAPLHALNIAHKKAYTAASFKVSSLTWQDKLANQHTILNALLREDKFTYLGGGIPIFLDKPEAKQLLGAIGVSGATEQQDIACAQAAVDAFIQKRITP